MPEPASQQESREVTVGLSCHQDLALKSRCSTAMHIAHGRGAQLGQLSPMVQNFLSLFDDMVRDPLLQDYGEETEGHSVLQEFFKNK